jgi:hypothetical protein
MKTLSLIMVLGLVGCASTEVTSRPISYPWLCEQDHVAHQCTRLGYEVNTDEPALVMAQARDVCPQGAKSFTSNEHTHKTLIVCK